MQNNNGWRAIVPLLLLFTPWGANAEDGAVPKIGIVSASGCYFLSPTDEKHVLQLDDICDAGLDAGWETHLATLVADAGIYAPVDISFDRDQVRAVLHDAPNTAAILPPQFDLKESMPFLVELAEQNDVDMLLILRADGNRLNNGFWMNHTGILGGALMRKPALYYSAELILVDARAGKKVKSSAVKGRYSGDLASIPHVKLDKTQAQQGLGEPGSERRAQTLAQLDDVARDALGRTLPKVVRKKKRRKR